MDIFLQLHGFQVINETSGSGITPLRPFDAKYVYNYIETSQNLYTANSLDLNRHFTSINRIFEQNTISTNFDDTNWLYSKI